MPSPWSIEALFCPKAGNSVEEYEDAWSVRVDEASGRCRLAVADGATESSFAKTWANLLVEAYAASRAAGPEFFDELGPARSLWRSRSLSRPLPWYAAEKATYGAFAALVGLSVDAATRAWRSVAIGDCCLFQLDACKPAMRVVRAFPLTRASQFGTTPFLLGTAEPSAAELGAHVKVCTGSLREDDVILLVSDALGAWLLRHEEESEPLWRRVVFELRTQDAFAAWVQEAREKGMRNDDVTLVRLVFHDAAGAGAGDEEKAAAGTVGKVGTGAVDQGGTGAVGQTGTSAGGQASTSAAGQTGTGAGGQTGTSASEQAGARPAGQAGTRPAGRAGADADADENAGAGKDGGDERDGELA